MKFYWNYDKKMDSKEFNQHRKEFFDTAMSLSDAKSIEYTISSDDRLANFKNVASRLGITPMQALMVYVLKHIDAICNDAKTGKQFSDETFTSRAHDVVNYMVLATALHKETHTTEDQNNEDNTKPNRNGTSSNSGYGANGSKPDKWNQLKRNEKTRPRY